MSGQIDQCIMVESAEKSVQIIDNLNGKFVLNESNLRSILTNPIAENKPIYIISIIGSFRTGKSFLLNLFLNYLKCGQNEQEFLQGFKWSYGSSPHTKGIWMWNTPIPVQMDSSGKQICVLLMDTQGTFDNDSTQTECATIFSLSAFLSSIKIYNIKSNIEKTDLEYLSLFSQFKKLTDNLIKNTAHFEKLCFLVRDWQYPEEYDYGFDGGEKFLLDRLKNDLNIKNFFNNKNCFLMPNPGRCVLKKNFTGAKTELDEMFLRYCSQFFKQTINSIEFNQDCLLFKNGENLFNLFKEYFEIFSSNNLPNLDTIADVYQKHNNLISKQTELFNYKIGFKHVLELRKPFMVENEILNEHLKLKTFGLNNYRNNLMLLNDSELHEKLSELEQEFELLFKEYQLVNTRNKLEFLNEIESNCLNIYEQEIKAYLLHNKNSFLKPIDLFLKHQQIKSTSLMHFEKLRHEFEELNEFYSNLNDKIDKKLEFFDKEVCFNNANLINNVKNRSIHEYKMYMDEKCLNFDKKKVLTNEKIHEYHIEALEKSMEEFERLTKLDLDINKEYESLVNEIRGLYSGYLIMNQNKNSKEAGKGAFDLVKFKTPFDLFRQNSTTKNPVDLIQATIYTISLIICLFTSYFMLLNDFLFNIRVKYSNVFSQFKFIFKLFFNFFSDFTLDFFTLFLSNLKNYKTRVLN